MTKKNGDTLRRDLFVELEGTEARIRHDMETGFTEAHEERQELRKEMKDMKGEMANLRQEMNRFGNTVDKLYDLMVSEVARLKEAVFGR